MNIKTAFFKTLFFVLAGFYFTMQASVPVGVIKLTTGIFANGGQARGVGVDSNGKIAVCGYTLVGGQRRWTVARFTSSGTLDSNFNTTGYVQSSRDGTEAIKLVIQSDNKIVVVGVEYNSGQSANTAWIIRYNTNGSVDKSASLNDTAGSRAYAITLAGTILATAAVFPSGGNCASSYSQRDTGSFDFPNIFSSDPFTTSSGFIPTAAGGVALVTSDYKALGSMVTGASSTSGFGNVFNNSIFYSGGGAATPPFIGVLRQSGFNFALYSDTSSIILADQNINVFNTGASLKTITSNSNTTYPFRNAGQIRFYNDDSKIIICGASTAISGSSSSPQPFVTRRLSNGGTDSGFNSGNILVQSDAVLTPGMYQDLIAQSDGKIVTVGFTNQADANGQWIMARYTTTGTLDSSFGLNLTGVLRDTAAPFNTNLAGLITTTTIDQSGKLVVAGNYGTNSQCTRYTFTGTRDLTFSGDGVALGDLAATATINKVINNGTGYLVSAASGGPNSANFTVASYSSAGALNGSFGSSGIKRETGFGAGAGYDMLLNGTALAVAGVTNTSIPSVVNYNSSTGVHDPAIGTDGLQTFSQLGTGTIYGINTTTSTSRYGAGQGTSSNTAFVRLLINGTGLLQDTADPFNTSANALLYSTTIDQSGNLLVGGQYSNLWEVVSYLTTGTRNTSFGTDGVAVAPGFASGGRARSLALDSTGRIIAVGASQVGPDEIFTTVRYNSTGTTSSTVQETLFGVGSGLGLGINDDDSFAVTGFTTTGDGDTPTVITYTPDFEQNFVSQFPSLAPGYFYGIQTTDNGSKFVAGATQDTALLYMLLDGTGLLLDTDAPFDTHHNGYMYGGMFDQTSNLVLCGNYNNVFTIVRYTSIGERNPFYGGNDGTLQDSSLGVANGYAITQDSAGSYYVAASSTVSSTQVFTVVKYTNDGQLDTSFNSTGVIQETGLGIGKAMSIALNSDGTVLVGGQTTVNGVLLPTLIPYTADGDRLTTFGANGVQTFNRFGAGILNGLSIINISTVAGAGQMGSAATVVEFGQSNAVLAQIESGF